MNAVIVDIRRKQAAALDVSGRIVRIPNANYEIGQTIELHAVKPVHAPTILKRLSTGVAAAVLVAIIGTGTAYAVPYGTVTLDGDTSIEYTINCFDYVLDVQAMNDEGESLLAEIDTRRLRHHRIDAAVGAMMERIEQRGHPKGATPELQLQMETLSDVHSERLRQELTPIMERRNPQPEPTEGTDFSGEHSAFPEQAGDPDTESAHTPAPPEAAWKDAGAQMQDPGAEAQRPDPEAQAPPNGTSSEAVEEQQPDPDPFSEESTMNGPGGEPGSQQQSDSEFDPGGKP